MEPFNAFVSYSHKDEWLKDEFIEAMAAITRSGHATLWDDRKILAGEYLETEISKALYSADIMFLLVSSSFISSNYCMEVEFKTALKRQSDGDLHIMPIIIRDCDFEIDPLQTLNFAPNDAIPVNPEGVGKDENEKRDTGWKKVTKEVRKVLDKLNERRAPIDFQESYIANRKNSLMFDHNRVGLADLSILYQEPEMTVSVDDGEALLEKTEDLIDFILSGSPLMIGGDDKSGKSTLLLRIQEILCHKAFPAVIIKGADITNNDPSKLISKSINTQLDTEQEYKISEIIVLLDDIDECKLKEGRLAKSIGYIVENCKGVAASSFSTMNAVLLRNLEKSEITSINLENLPPNKVYELVERWCELGIENRNDEIVQKALSEAYQSILKLLHGGAVPTYPGIIISFLKVLDTVSGSDLAMTSNAACYDSLITLQLGKAGVSAGRIEVLKNFLGHFAGGIFEIDTHLMPERYLIDIRSEFESTFFEDLTIDFEKLYTSKILVKDSEDNISFNDKFVLYLFVGRYFSTVLKIDYPDKYNSQIADCIRNVRYRSYANILLYSLYFSNDVDVLEKLVNVLDQKFRHVDKWKLSRNEEVYVSINKDIFESLEVGEDFRSTRLESLQKNYASYELKGAADAEAYISPFSTLSNTIIVSIDDDKPGTFIGDMNSLFRMQSIIGNAINTRQGTFKREIVLKCVNSLIKSSGRFAHENLDQTRKLLGNLDIAIKHTSEKFPKDDFKYLAEGSEQYNRQKSNFISTKIQDEINFHGRWAIISSQGVLGRVLSQNNTNIALHELYLKEEAASDKNDEFNYNYLMAYGISSLWQSGKIDREFYDNVMEKYGDIGFVRDVLSFSIFVFSRYMPISVKDRQWLSNKLKMRLQSFRYRQRKLLPKHKQKNNEGG